MISKRLTLFFALLPLLLIAAGTGYIDPLTRSSSTVAFGAKCDGVTDDTTAIQAAINYLAAAGGGVTWIGASATACLISSEITLPRNVSLRGQGVKASVVNCGMSSGACVAFSDASGGALSTIANGGGLRDLTLNGSGGTSIGLYLGGDPAGVMSPSGNFGDGGYFSNVKLTGFDNNIQLGNNAFLETFSNLYNYNAIKDGFLFPGSLTNAGENIKFYGGQWNTDGNTFEENASTGPSVVYFYGTSFDFSGPMTGSQLYATCFGCHLENLSGAFVNTSSSGGSGNSSLTFEQSEFFEDRTSGTLAALFVLNGNLDKISIDRPVFSTSSGQTVTNIISLPGGASSQLINITNVNGYSTTSNMASWLSTSAVWSGLHIEPNNPTAPVGSVRIVTTLTSATSVTTGGNEYMVMGGLSAATTLVTVNVPEAHAGTYRNLFCIVNLAPGTSNSWVMALTDNGADKSVTCTIADAATTCSDTTHSFTSVQGDLMATHMSVVGTPGNAPLQCSYEKDF